MSSESGHIDRVGGARAELTRAALWRFGSLDPPVRYVGTVGLLALLYYGAARLGFALDFAGPVASVVWLPVGVAIAFLYIAGVKFWPGVVLGDLLANNYSALPVGSAFGQTLGNLIEVLVAVLLMRRLMGRNSSLETVRQIAGLVLAIAVGTGLSAVIGSFSLRLGHVISTGGLSGVVRTWWLGDFSGALIVVPLALAWCQPFDRAFWRGRAVEALLALAAVIGLSELVLRGDNPLSYLVFPALIWAGLRLRLRGSTVAIAVTAGFAVWATRHYVGPFDFHSLTRSVLETQLFIVVASLSTLSLAAVVSERERFAESLFESRARLIEAVDAERRRIERDLHDGIQQELVSVRITLGLAGELIDETPVRSERMIAAAGRQIDESLGSIRALAAGIYPTLLRDGGVDPALRSAARRVPPPVSVRARGIGRYSDDLERAVYFCCLEALQNAVKHAGPDIEIAIELWTSGRWLHFRVSDSGTGFDPAEVHAGSGLTNMRDRIAAVRGTLTINSHKSRGTWVHGRVPTQRSRNSEPINPLSPK